MLLIPGAFLTNHNQYGKSERGDRGIFKTQILEYWYINSFSIATLAVLKNVFIFFRILMLFVYV